ncbi:GNAT family N-acetyltransferase [Flagellimonas nanhaiensis]|uniref:GNAT family N-acetyltransferase n=1 Tax=Flagellimonas nanhaiensis TaxID=2292706 RepID=A0A371JS38_9FLAO|nr:GNAT family N-acetyltransferase [Allomuricauda nanhaiensis]RDY60266.1 GNAT family N-acetyltransferase [Allomuricauda nanhaiensis]
METTVKSFNQLSNAELYEIMRLRSEVFVVEQNCVYQDLDNKDQKAIHVLGKMNEELVGYVRIFKPGDYFENVAIGRVVVPKSQRRFGYGKLIMQSALKVVENEFPKIPIELSAQTYLIKFYKELGFKTKGEEYLEDGIPHILMVKKED